MRKPAFALVLLLLVVAVILLGVQQWRSWRLDHSLTQASRAVATARGAALAIEFSVVDDCSPSNSELYAAWRASFREASIALGRLESVRGPGSPHLQILARRLAAVSETVSLARFDCEVSEAVYLQYAAPVWKQKEARARRLRHGHKE